MRGEILLVRPEWKLETNGDNPKEKEYSSPETQKIQTKETTNMTNVIDKITRKPS